MSYKFISEREPTDQELFALTDSAIKQANQKKEQAMKSFMANIHSQIQKIKNDKLHVKQA
ncbi:hypothetical protein [Thiomicrorhabdus aquaedulcis]|uniref:hypothetical protein n=1 Tax=Thiomicrorhabdus aquaedulcis TaxID=2211106 RepID=UPI000FD7419D|nr:hypothetical protein [Thiomicrorhabdus aquaedulcis]